MHSINKYDCLKVEVNASLHSIAFHSLDWRDTFKPKALPNYRSSTKALFEEH